MIEICEKAKAINDRAMDAIDRYVADVVVICGFEVVPDLRSLMNMRGEFFLKVCSEVCESPIEQILFAEMYWGSYGICGHAMDVVCPSDEFSYGTILQERYSVAIMPQYKVRRNRVDFLLQARVKLDSGDTDMCQYAIECDGHDFHERTKEQAKRDRSRDRQLTDAGLKVLRFTGSEIYQDSHSCFQEIANSVVSFWGGVDYHDWKDNKQ